ncbi:ankyrin repeat domain family member sosondowah isoform X2 [Haematobia irritans]|uniref:ankyrin repeat domain family member sosondowah isoform X2 n=1 Tax=Haematobia irritans TaxID=7368 RepID=UPI003F508D91
MVAVEIKAKRKPTAEKDSGFLRIGSLNVRVKKTTEAFSNFLGVGNGNGSSMPPHPHAASTASLPHQRHPRHHHYPHHLHHGGTMRTHPMHPTMMKKSSTTMSKKKMHHHLQPGSRASAPINNKQFDMLHKSWGSADNITQNGGTSNDDESLMPPPKGLDTVKKRQQNTKRSSISSTATDSPRDSISSTSSSNFNSGYSSMPTTPNQLRSPLGLVGVVQHLNGDSDSDSACGFDSNWSINGREFPTQRKF